MTSESTTIDERRSEAFKTLVEVVQSFTDTGRVCVGASAKPRLKSQLPSFDERELGYRSFREFVEAAQTSGFVRTARRGNDIELLPPAAPGSGERIRPDFWRAVVQVTDAKRRFYDRAADHILELTEDQPVDGQLIPVPTADAEVQQQWIDEFLEGLGEDGEALCVKVAAADSLPAKLREISAEPSVRAKWYRERTRHVADLLQQWASENELAVRLTEPAARRDARHAARPTGGVAYETHVRERLTRAIQQMPLAELLRLPIPVEYLIDA